uniref:hypothetical protein n=1 Tax=Mariniflexile sp. TaxID=1979402 RepID=UPI0040481E50
MKYLILILLLFVLNPVIAQDQLFIGLYTKKESDKSYWCSDMVMEKKIVKSDDEALQAKKDFLIAHSKENPITKIAKNSHIILYEFQKPQSGFGCNVKVISWKELDNKSSGNIRTLINNENQRIQKEYKSSIKEIFDWQYTGNTLEDFSSKVDEIEFILKVAKNETSGLLTTLAVIKNPLKDRAAQFIFILDGVPDKKPHIIQPNSTSQINLGKSTSIGVKLQLIPAGAVPEQSYVDWIKEKIRLDIIQNRNKQNTGNTPIWGVRG